MPQAGRLRERCVIERDEGGVRDQYGATPSDWQPLATLWCDFRETPGKEAIAAGRLEGTATGTLRLRKSTLTASLTSADRVRVRGRLWNIRGLPVETDNRNRMVELKLEAGVAAGA